MDVYCDLSGWTSLRTRAAFDLSCAVRDLEVVVIDQRTFGVTGCGQKATYKYVENIGFVSDSFRPTPVSQQLAPPPAPPK